MSSIIFPTWIPNGTPASDDRILFSDTSDSDATFDAPVSALPISTATQAALDGKVDKVSGKGLSTEDYTTSEKNKLAGIEAGAEVNEVNEAPTDGRKYARKNGAWSVVTGGGGGGGQVDSVNGQTWAVVLDADSIDDTVTTNKFTTASDISKLAGIEAGAEVNVIDSVYVEHSTIYNSTQDDVFPNVRERVISFDDGLGTPASRRVDFQTSTSPWTATLLNNSSVAVRVYDSEWTLETILNPWRAAFFAINGSSVVPHFFPLPKTFSDDIIVPDEAYDATAWNGNNEVPTKNAIRDKIESMSTWAAFEVKGSFDGELVAGSVIRVLMKGTGTLTGLKAKAGVASAGASIKIDVRKNTNASTSSVFTSDAPLEITAGSTSLVTKTTIDNGTWSDGDVMLIVVTQTGSTVSGADVSFILY